MKKWLPILLIPFIGTMIFNSSCNKDGEEDTFNLDTLAVKPSTIDESFTIAWGVTTTGYPQFNIDFYISEDGILSEDDLLIGETSSIDYSNEDIFDEEQYFRIAAIPGSNNVEFSHNEKSQDINDNNWVVSEGHIANPSGTTKYIIGHCSHITGLVIQYGTRRIPVPVTFQ